VESGLISRDQSGRLFDRFRRRITFAIANESGKVVAFGCRALGDDLPKYLNSPETPIYSKSNVLYYMDRAKDAIRRQDFAVLVEGYMDAIAVARAGINNVVASCGTSLAEPQIKLLGRFTKRVIVNYDPDAAGQAARSAPSRCSSSRISRCACWRSRRWRQESRSRFVHSREGGRRTSKLERIAAVCGLPDCAGPANGFDDGRRQAARLEFSDALFAKEFRTGCCARNGPRGFRSNCASMSQCCARR